MLKICLDATPVRDKPSGVGVYTLNLLKALDKLQQSENFELTVYFQPALKNWLKGNLYPTEILQPYAPRCLPIPVTVTNGLMSFPNPLLTYFARSLNQPDIVQGTDHFVYPCRNSRNIMTIHDLTFVKYPDYVPTIVKTYLARIKRCLKWTDAIITFSENTKRDLVTLLHIDPNKIHVTYQASRYHQNYLNSEQIEVLKTTTNYDFAKPYFLFVSTLEPRKNVINLIQAFNYLKQNHKIEHQLVLIGQMGWKYEPILEAINQSPYHSEIHHLNYLSDKLVALFYTQAEAFIYPSFYEGFGLPVLEAMTLGAPVITSNTSSLPEVTGDAALLIDPNNFLELAEAMLKVISDRALRDQLTTQGKKQAQKFSWNKTAQDTLTVYRSIFDY
ncbi:MAG: glycosyltransferase family 1 protein [Snowella sp.]|nr:glycosyltransferase family 1 protein [Snowella sp.]